MTMPKRAGVGGPDPEAASRANGIARPSGIPPRSPEVRKCPRCGKSKPLDQFARDKSKSSGHKSHCKRCDAEKSASYYADHAERVITRVTKRRRATRGEER
jgi:hypothetical protein